MKGFRKNFLIKRAAAAVVFCLMLENTFIYAYAEDNTNSLHNASEGEEVKEEEQQKIEHSNSEYIIFNGEEANKEERTEEEIKKDEITEEEIKKDEITEEEIKKDEIIEEEIKKDEITEDETREEINEGKDTVSENNIEDTEQDIVHGNDAEDTEKDTVSGNDTEDMGKDTVSGNDTEDMGKDTVSGNDIEDAGKDTVSGNDLGDIEKEEQEIINVVVPTAYTFALNPYCLPIKTGGDTISTDQIISGTYGIVNKSSTDQIVTVSLTIEDGNGEKLIFADSAEEAENAGMNVYAIYLAAVPANEEQVLIEGEPVDGNVTEEALQNVKMTGAEEQGVALHAGTNQISFKLSRAIYAPEPDEEFVVDDLVYEEDTADSEKKQKNVFRELAPDGKGVTAYTFSGVMNPNAEWEKLSGGIKLSAVYTYQTADGSEEIVEGTGAMIPTD